VFETTGALFKLLKIVLFLKVLNEHLDFCNNCLTSEFVYMSECSSMDAWSCSTYSRLVEHIYLC